MPMIGGMGRRLSRMLIITQQGIVEKLDRYHRALALLTNFTNAANIREMTQDLTCSRVTFTTQKQQLSQGPWPVSADQWLLNGTTLVPPQLLSF